MKLNGKTTVSELMKQHPSVIAVFIERKLGCVGCPTEAFHTLEDVAHMNGLELNHLLEDLEQAKSAKEAP
jgi:hybrid cluster-associated redox disulfide protein